jgi:23S rRNA pseudouridine1911/1915/1917 synthase
VSAPEEEAGPQTRETFRADRGDAAQRLDRVLVRRLAGLPGLSRTRLQTWIGEGRVRVNGAPARRAADRLAAGDVVEVLLPSPPRSRRPPEGEEIPLAILYEDEWLIALAKPPGLVVHPTFGHGRGTLLNALLWHLRKEGDETARPGFAGRLDKDTSGVVVAAKSGSVHGRLARAMRLGKVEKDYLTVVYGAPRDPRGRIERGILRDPGDPRRMTTSRTEGRPSVTLWESLGSTSGPGVPLTLLRCRLLTGRTHQIRVHLVSAGLPIVGDPVYGEPRWKGVADPVLAAACRGFPRQALHAWRLAFPHPATGDPLVLVAPPPQDLQGLLDAAGLEMR